MKAKYILTALFLVLLVPTLDYARTWTDKFGKTIEGKFVRVTGDTVVILRGNKPVTVPLIQLSDEDQEYVRSQAQKINPKDDVSRKKIENPFEEAEKESQTPATKPPTSRDKAAPSDVGGDFSERTWVDVKGNRLVAKFVNLEDTMVVLSKDGVRKKYPLNKFSASDRLYINQQVQKLRREGNTPASTDFALAGGNSSANEAPDNPSPSPAITPGQQNVLSRGQELIQKMEADRQARQAQMEAKRQAQQAQMDAERQARQAQMEAEMQRLEQEARVRAETQQTANPMPPMSDIPAPQYTETHVFYCTKCKKEVSQNVKVGDRCPHCGVVWDFQKDEKGKIVATSPGRYYTGILKVISGVIVIVIVLFRILARRG